MRTNRIFNVIIGPSHSGKSTVAKAFANSETRIRLSADQIRSSIPRYNKNNPEHCRIRNHLFEISLDAYFSSGAFDIFCEIPRSLISSVGAYINKAQNQYGFKTNIVFLDASTEKLLERFNQSIVSAKKKGFTLAVDTEADFLANVNESRDLIAKIQETVLIQGGSYAKFDTTNTSSDLLVHQVDSWMFAVNMKNS